MSKIYKLREWLTVPEAAKQLSISFSEEVTEADVLRLALDKRLRLSVYFVNHARARCGKVVSWEETDWQLAPRLDKLPGAQRTKKEEQTGPIECRPCPSKLQALFNELSADEYAKYFPMMMSFKIGHERFVTLSDEVTTLRGVWDLPMIGAEYLDVEHAFQNLTDGPAVTLQTLEGACVEGPEGTICQLQESFDENEFQPGSRAALEKLKQHIVENGIEGDEAKSLLSKHKEERKAFLETQESRPAKQNYYPAGGLPEDAVLVIRTEYLRNFEQSVNVSKNGTEKPLTTTERNTLLTIIAALCEHSAIDHQERGAAKRLAMLTEEIGTVVSDDTVRRWLKLIPEALETRRK